MKNVVSLGFLAFAAALILSGCATSPIPTAQKANIKRVKVEPRVEIEQPFQYGYQLEGYNLSAALSKAVVKAIYRDNTRTATVEQQFFCKMIFIGNGGFNFQFSMVR